MATRSEQLKAEGDRNRSVENSRDNEKPPKKAGNGGHAEKAATVVREEPSAEGKRSRMSSRKSANHAKPNGPLEHAVAMKKGTPKARAERARARAQRGRGAG